MIHKDDPHWSTSILNYCLGRVMRSEGLPHPAVYSIARDPFGFLWFGTEGLARYDGHRFVVYRPDPSSSNTPASGQIDTLYTDHAGMLWVGTLDGGLNRLDPATGRFTRCRHDSADPYSLSDDHVTAILDDGRGGFWVATRGGLNRFDPATGRFITHRHDRADPSSIGGDHVTALLRDSAGALWVGVAGAGLYGYDEARGLFAGTDNASPCFVTIQPTPVAGAPPFPFELRYHQAAIDERLDVALVRAGPSFITDHLKGGGSETV